LTVAIELGTVAIVPIPIVVHRVAIVTAVACTFPLGCIMLFPTTIIEAQQVEKNHHCDTHAQKTHQGIVRPHPHILVVEVIPPLGHVLRLGDPIGNGCETVFHSHRNVFVIAVNKIREPGIQEYHQADAEQDHQPELDDLVVVQISGVGS
jgi:hypothetical protein